jgi:titin
MNMFRVDGWTYLDFSVLSAREIDLAPWSPTNLTAATVGYNQIDLSWTDASDDESGFKIERQHPNAYGNYVQIGTVG